MLVVVELMVKKCYKKSSEFRFKNCNSGGFENCLRYKVPHGRRGITKTVTDKVTLEQQWRG